MKRAQKVSEAAPTGQYLVLKGISYNVGGVAGSTSAPAEVRVEAGEMLPAGFPPETVQWLEECGAIRPVFEIGGQP